MINLRKLCKVIVYPFYRYHSLLILKNCQRIVFHTLGNNAHFGQLSYFCQYRIINRCHLSFCRNNLNLWVESCKKRSYKVVKTVKHAQNDD